MIDAADQTDMPALNQLDASLEGHAARLKDPYDENLLAWYCWIVTRHSGFLAVATVPSFARMVGRLFTLSFSAKSTR